MRVAGAKNDNMEGIVHILAILTPASEECSKGFDLVGMIVSLLDVVVVHGGVVGCK
jgi:hypothetical protein